MDKKYFKAILLLFFIFFVKSTNEIYQKKLIYTEILNKNELNYKNFQEKKINDNLSRDSIEEVSIEQKKEKKRVKKSELTSIININTANKEQLMELPGVGEKMAEKIIEYRKNEKFQTIEDIMKVKGIGPKKFDKMKSRLKV